MTGPTTARDGHRAPPSRESCATLDAADPLASLRELFVLPPDTIYLDGNSLGVLPRTTAARVAQAVQQEWGQGLIRSWNSAGWMEMPARIGDKIARLVGAAPGELVVTDSTSVNLFKVLSAAVRIAHADAPQRTRIVSERSNFPTDLYIAQAVAEDAGLELVLADADTLPALLDASTAVLMLTQVNYRNGRLHDMATLTDAAHAAGALTVWDLAHSAGALQVDLIGCDADFAVGCGYKYLNGGPGAPAFVWVHRRHVERFRQPLAGWIGHAAPFRFSTDYEPAPGIGRYLCGTPPVLSMAALECGVDTVLAAEPLGGMAALRQKSLALTSLFAALVDARCAGRGLTVVSPRDDARRGSQVCLSHHDDTSPGSSHAIVQALIERGVIGDFRAGDRPGAVHDIQGVSRPEPDILRFGFTPLYTRFVDVWDAVEHLREVLDSGTWREPRFQQRAAVT